MGLPFDKAGGSLELGIEVLRHMGFMGGPSYLTKNCNTHKGTYQQCPLQTLRSKHVIRDWAEHYEKKME